MTEDLFRILSLSARYFFVFMLFFIVLRSYIWLKRDNASFKLYQKSVANAGVIGEAVVIFGGSTLQTGKRFNIYREGIIGSGKNCDLQLNSRFIHKRQAYYRLETGVGLYLELLHNGDISINAFEIDKNVKNAYIINGSILKLADVAIQVFFYPGFSVPTLSPSEMQTVMENVRILYNSQLGVPQVAQATIENDMELLNSKDDIAETQIEDTYE